MTESASSPSSTAISYPSAARAAIFSAARRPLEIELKPIPVLLPSEALVRIDCCTVCGSDLHTFTGARQEPTPTILGHEILGTVIHIPDDPPADVEGRPLQPGDRITWSTAVSCFECDRCRSGLPQKCRSLAKYGHAVAEGRTALSGGLAEYILLRRGTTAVRVDPSLPDEVACPANCATATVVAAFRAARSLTGRRVLILGAGLLGLTAAAMADARGAAHVTLCDLNPDRLGWGSRFGADSTVVWTSAVSELRARLTTAAGHSAYDVILELSGSADAVEAAVQLADIGGDVILVGTVLGTRPVALDPESIVRKCLSIRGVHNYAPDDLRDAVAFLESSQQRYPFAELVAKSFPLAEINAALAYALEHRPVRIAIRP